MSLVGQHRVGRQAAAQARQVGGQVRPGDAGFGEVANGVEKEAGVVADAAMLTNLAQKQVGDALPVIVAEVVSVG